MRFLSTHRVILLVASLVFAGGASVFFGQAAAQDVQAKKTVETVSIAVKDDVRYISAYGIPRHIANNYQAKGIVPKSYAFKVDATPTAAKKPTTILVGDVFGVSLDGVPIKHATQGLWNNKSEWPRLKTSLDSYGGVMMGSDYIYAGVPSGLVSKDLSHVGYAADGFPIFVSKENKLETSYRLRTGTRTERPLGPGGVFDGQYLTDYRHIPKAGLLDACNGVKVKNKFYIYIITKDAPHLPLCWTGTPDPTFLASSGAIVEQPNKGSDRFGVQDMEQSLR